MPRKIIGWCDDEYHEYWCDACFDVGDPWHSPKTYAIREGDRCSGKCCECGTEIVTHAVKNRDGED